jgi:predicted ribosome quality control (RQC) complex YloA/Tae2 family protein
VHNNYYYLRQLSGELGSTLTGSVVSECFSQSLDELIVRFEIGSRSFLIRASLQPGLGCLSFPENLQRAKRNSVDLFRPLIGERVTGVRQFRNERSFSLQLSHEFDLLFKMHGTRTNLVLFERGAVLELFRNNLASDANLDLQHLDRDIDFGYDNFLRNTHNLKAVYFTFGRVVWRYLEEHGFSKQPPDEQWQSIQSLVKELNHPSYYVTDIEGKPTLSLVNTGAVMKTWTDPVGAANDFFRSITQDFALAKEKSALLRALKARIASGEEYQKKNAARLDELRRDEHFRLWADLIMANLHAIAPGSDKIVVDNFYAGNTPVEISLKKGLTPQKTAEIFYRKAKNRQIEIERTERVARQKGAEIDEHLRQVKEVEEAGDLRSLRHLKEKIDPATIANKQTLSLPYREFIFRGYRIWVGKSAGHNDTLTLKYSHKDDLWLHAKDVAGSHVLIKHQSGENYPKDVIAYAASLAAANSKRKNESLCPVVVTPKKFVRKRKGDPPGVVVVEREEVVMAEPGVN